MARVELAIGRRIGHAGRGLAVDPDDRQSRYLEAATGGLLVSWLYLTNGNPPPGPRVDEQLARIGRTSHRAADCAAQGLPSNRPVAVNYVRH